MQRIALAKFFMALFLFCCLFFVCACSLVGAPRRRGVLRRGDPQGLRHPLRQRFRGARPRWDGRPAGRLSHRFVVGTLHFFHFRRFFFSSWGFPMVGWGRDPHGISLSQGTNCEECFLTRVPDRWVTPPTETPSLGSWPPRSCLRDEPRGNFFVSTGSQ